MTVYVGGTFDLFHAGHVSFLRRCSAHGRVHVALNTDEFAARYKRKPIYPLAERLELVGSCRYVSGVTVNTGGEDSKPSILVVRPRFIAHGDDWTGDSLLGQMGLTPKFLDEHGIRMLYVPYASGVSSSEIIRRIGTSGLAP